MSLTNILEELRNLALKISPTLSEFSIHIDVDNDIGIKLKSRTGIDIDLTEVSIDPNTGVWVYQGHHVFLFTPDQGRIFDDVISGEKEGRKFHLTDCQTIDDMKQKDRFFRYQATNNTEGIFAIIGVGKFDNTPKTGEARLHVCKNCLTKLNFKNYANAHYKEKTAIYNNFDLDEFFECYQTSFIKEPPYVGQDKAGYSDDWDDISKNYRQKQSWICEQCHVDLSNHRSLLDTHHINGVRHDNRDDNLKALCKDCHKKQPHHGHYYVSHNDILKLTMLRKMQRLA